MPLNHLLGFSRYFQMCPGEKKGGGERNEVKHVFRFQSSLPGNAESAGVIYSNRRGRKVDVYTSDLYNQEKSGILIFDARIIL